MVNRPGASKGFTLIELVIIVGIISILAALAYPTYYYFLKKARQVEAKVLLGDIHRLETAYFGLNDRYSYDFDELGFSVGNIKYYRDLRIMTKGEYREEPDEAVGKNFIAIARGNIDPDPDLDVWTIDENKDLIHVQTD